MPMIVVSDADDAEPVDIQDAVLPAPPEFVMTDQWADEEVVDLVEKNLVQLYGHQWKRGTGEWKRHMHKAILDRINLRPQRTRRTTLSSPLEVLQQDVKACFLQTHFASESEASDALEATAPMQTWLTNEIQQYNKECQYCK
jgi:hypothetical protein